MDDAAFHVLKTQYIGWLNISLYCPCDEDERYNGFISYLRNCWEQGKFTDKQKNLFRQIRDTHDAMQRWIISDEIEAVSNTQNLDYTAKQMEEIGQEGVKQYHDSSFEDWLFDSRTDYSNNPWKKDSTYSKFNAEDEMVDIDESIDYKDEDCVTKWQEQETQRIMHRLSYG